MRCPRSPIVQIPASTYWSQTIRPCAVRIRLFGTAVLTPAVGSGQGSLSLSVRRAVTSPPSASRWRRHRGDLAVNGARGKGERWRLPPKRPWVRLPVSSALRRRAENDRRPRMGKERAVVDDVPSAFEIADYDRGDAPGLTVRGEIDISTGPQLQLALDKAIRESAGAFVLDMSELEMLDSSGLNLVLRARASLARDERHSSDRVSARARSASDRGRGRGRSLLPL